MAEEDGISSFWDDLRVEFVVQCIQSTYPKLAPGQKFDKLFKTEATRYVEDRLFDCAL